MENNLIYKQQRKVSAAYIDSTLKLGVANSVVMLQDNFTECYEMLQIDGIRMKRDYNDFWVFTRTRMHFEKRPNWMDEITVETFPIQSSGLRANVNSIFKDKEGNTLITVNQEACVLDCDKHRPVKLSAIPFPTEGFPEPVYTEQFEKFDVEFSEENFVYENTIHSQQIDMSHHMNNTKYVELAMNAFDVAFLENHEIKTLEIHYTGESQEGQILKIYRKDIENASFIKIMQDSRSVAELKIEY